MMEVHKGTDALLRSLIQLDLQRENNLRRKQISSNIYKSSIPPGLEFWGAVKRWRNVSVFIMYVLSCCLCHVMHVYTCKL